MKSTIFLTALFLFAVCSYAEAQGEGLNMPFVFENGSRAWNVVDSEEGDSMRMVEFVRSGQTKENWNEQVAIFTINKARVRMNLEDKISFLENTIKAHCSEAMLEVIEQSSDSGLFEVTGSKCETDGKPDEDTHALARILEGEFNGFITFYSVRRELTMTPERRAEWIGKLRDLAIMKF